MLKNGGKKIKDLNLFGVKNIKITRNRVSPCNEFIKFKKQDIHQSIACYFEKQVRKYPKNIAVKTKNQELTYGQLNKKSNQAAWTILQWCGQKPGGAALLFEHDSDMIIGIISALKANKFYIPLDPTNPLERLIYILKDTDAKILLTNNKNIEVAQKLKTKVANQIKIININTIDAGISYENTGLEMNSQNPAYILYTSGSTGKPKGVIQAQNNVLHHTRVYTNNLHINAGDRLTLFSSYGFDAAVMDIFGALLNGAALYPFAIMEEGNLERLSAWLREEQITIYHSVPTVYRYFMNILNSSDTGEGTGSKTFPQLRFIVLGGEVVYKKDIENYKKYFSRDCLFINGLGPTESTLTLQYFVDKETAADGESVPVGFPVDETRVLLLDENNREAQIYSPGEIIYKSDYLALGYANMPEKTAKIFVTDPLTGTDRIFRTGDFGRRWEDGNIEFLRRMDHQVKIRGYTIDLGEIESRLLSHEAIEEAVVVNHESEKGEKYLCAYFVTAYQFDKISENANLRQYLSRTLPDFMIPSYFIKLDKIPLNDRGKIDRKALPEPEIKAGSGYIAPQNKTQEKLVEIWSEILGIEKEVISIDANFFQLGGHSLKATLMTARIHKKLEVKLLLAIVFKSPFIRELAECIKELREEKYASIEPTEKREFYRLSSAQKRLYILQQMNVASTAYNMPNIIPLAETIEIEKLEKTFGKLIARHENFRTSFEMINGKPVQRVHPQVEFTIDYYGFNERNGRFSLSGPPVPESQITNIIDNFVKPFDLSREILLRAGLIKREKGRCLLVVDLHHSISDGMSHEILVRDFTALYAGKALPGLRLHYKDYSQWKHSQRMEETFKKQEKYWLNQFTGEIPVLNLPTDYPRPYVQSFAGSTVSFALDSENTKALDGLAQSQGATLFMVLLAIYNVFLSKLSGQEDIVVGIPTAGRKHADLEQIIGMFVNTLALRNYPRGEKKFTEFLTQVKEKTLDGFDNQDYQFEDLVEKAPVPKDTSRNPLFDAMFILQNIYAEPDQAASTPGENTKTNTYAYDNKTSKFDLSLIGAERGKKLYFTFEFCTKLFKQENIERFVKYFIKIISSIIEHSEKKISEIEIITREEKRQLLYDFNDTAAGYPRDKTIHQLFEEQVQRTPDHFAVVGPPLGAVHESHLHQLHLQISYRELNKKSNQTAFWLGKKGIEPDTIVGIMVERSLELIIGILGILKSGAAYLPIDPGCPPERLDYILKDSNAIVLLAAPEAKVKKESIALIDISHLSSLSTLTSTSIAQVSPTNLAYVIYTSGTTGNPKGVMIVHHSLVNRLDWMQKNYPLDDSDTILQKTPFTFDVSIWEILWWAMVGAKVCLLIPGGEKDPKIIIGTIERNKVTVMHFVPSMLSVFLDYLKENRNAGRFSSLKQIIASGEELTASQVERFNQIFYNENSTSLANLYGPTEATIDVSYYNCPGKNNFEIIPIGKPINNICLYPLDKNLQLQPVGIPGELHISGAGLARGYLNLPELTAEKFLPNPFAPWKLLYRTGDLAKFLVDGNIKFLGRIDSQVKIRGFRIELGEIEARLIKHEAIKEAVVINREWESGEKYLCAYFVTAGNDKISKNLNLKDYLSRTLPDYMIPNYFIPIDQIPLTSNGKIDRKALPLPTNSGSKKHMPPRYLIEKKLVKIWSEVLNVHQVGINDDFFELGGHSLNLIMLASRIYKEFGLELPITELYKTRTIEEISRHITSEKYIETPVALLNKETQKKLFCFPPMIGYGIIYNNLASILEDYALYAFNFIEDENRLRQYVDLIKTIQPNGSYKLFGWSAAGKMIFKVAKELEKQGGQVSDIILADSFWNEKNDKKNDEELTNASFRDFTEAVERQSHIMGLDHLKEKIMNKIKKYRIYCHSVTCLDMVNANVHLILSEKKKMKELDPSKGWQKFTHKIYKTYQGFGLHIEMFAVGAVEKNAEIIKKILDGIE